MSCTRRHRYIAQGCYCPECNYTPPVPEEAPRPLIHVPTLVAQVHALNLAMTDLLRQIDTAHVRLDAQLARIIELENRMPQT